MDPARERSSSDASWRFVASVASVGAAAIHFGAAHAHLGEYRPAGVFMLATGVAQLGWALWVVAGAPRRVIAAGIAGNLAIVAVWFASRTAGMPWGMRPWVPEDVHANDALATGLELLLIAAAAALIDRHPVRASGTAVRLAVAGTLATTLVAGHEPGREQLAAAATLVLALGARALCIAVATRPFVRPVWRSHAQLAAIHGLRARAGALARAGGGDRW